jgi:hypothetical protein
LTPKSPEADTIIALTSSFTPAHRAPTSCHPSPRNESGKRLLGLCQQNGLVITNTFLNHSIHRDTCTIPDATIISSFISSW